MKMNNNLSEKSFLKHSLRIVTTISVLISFALACSGQNSTRSDRKTTSTENDVKAQSKISTESIRIALAQIKRGRNIPEGVRKIDSILSVCNQKGVNIVCFPETYLPGLRGGGYDSSLPEPDQSLMEKSLKEIQASCKKYRVSAIVGMEWRSSSGLENRAYVISEDGNILGHQTKNQITPGGEEEHYIPENTRSLFTINGVTFGIVICHEGWRYPETVRWAAVRGAKIVFQPQVTGGNESREYVPKPWGESYYEMAMILRSKENSIYFVSVNECMKKQNSASALIDPDGNLVENLTCGVEGLMVRDLDLRKATGFYARRYRPELYNENK
jgi:predicted amidohydrolase